METRVVYQTNEGVKNAKLFIIQFLIKQGVYVDSIQCSQQELTFISDKQTDNPDEHWSHELNSFFKGKINFKAKRPSAFN